MEGVAKSDIQSIDDFRITKGQNARLIYMTEDFWEIEFKGELGRIPSNSLEMSEMKWYYGNLHTQETAKAKLIEKENGFFLVRNTCKGSSVLVFCFLDSEEIHEIQILYDGENYELFGFSRPSVNKILEDICPNGKFDINNIPTKAEKKKLPNGHCLVDFDNFGHCLTSTERIGTIRSTPPGRN
jgi:hypothetical protein